MCHSCVYLGYLVLSDKFPEAYFFSDPFEGACVRGRGSIEGVLFNRKMLDNFPQNVKYYVRSITKKPTKYTST